MFIVYSFCWCARFRFRWRSTLLLPLLIRGGSRPRQGPPRTRRTDWCFRRRLLLLRYWLRLPPTANFNNRSLEPHLLVNQIQFKLLPILSFLRYCGKNFLRRLWARYFTVFYFQTRGANFTRRHRARRAHEACRAPR